MDVVGLIGITIIFTWSPLFTRVRRVYPKMLECAMCVGFWVGVFDTILTNLHAPWWAYVLHGGTVSVLAFAASLTLERLQASPRDEEEKVR